MNKEKIKTIAYWVITGLVAANYAFAGVIYIIRNNDVIEGMTKLGYPLYFITLLGVWKLLGAIALVIPRFPLVKEWAYAGIFFNLTSAAISSGAVGNPIGDVIAPLILLVFAAASWALRPESRRLVSTGL